VTAPAANNGREYTVFYLKYARAATVANTLRQILTGTVVVEQPEAESEPEFDPSMFFGGMFGGEGGGRFGGDGGGRFGGEGGGRFGGEGRRFGGGESSRRSETETVAAAPGSPMIIADSR